ncbi:MAG: right-handed parallel beta-helix repeat-containing protein [Candidatus Peribacteraceae bacterium]|nr:right-handed parallel beta-helix repeat-containing protein [Candidatus Peribacteraceae bacterium]
MSISPYLNTDGATKTAEEISPITSGVTVPDKAFFDGRTASTVDIVTKLQSEFRNPLDYGAVGDGVADDKAAIQSVIDQLVTLGGGVLFLPALTYRLASNITFPVEITLMLANGTLLNPDNNIIVTINSKLIAPKRQIFSSVHGNAIVFGDAAIDYIYPEWFELYINDSTDFQTGIGRAIIAMSPVHPILLTNKYAVGVGGWSGFFISGRDDLTIYGIGDASVKVLVVPSQLITKFTTENSLFKIEESDNFVMERFLIDTNQLDVWPLSMSNTVNFKFHRMKHRNPLFGASTPRTVFSAGSKRPSLTENDIKGALSLTVTGTTTATSATLTDTTKDFVALGVVRGMLCENTFSGSYGVADVVATTTVTMQESQLGGFGSLFGSGDTYQISGRGGGAGFFIGSTGPGAADYDVVMSRNRMVNCRTPLGGTFYGGKIVDNYIFNTGVGGIVASSARTDSGDIQEGRDVAVTGNVVIITEGHGIQADTVSGRESGLVFSGNFCKWNGASGLAITDTNGFVVSANTIINPHADGVGNGAGINIVGSNYGSITANSMDDRRATRLMTRGISVDDDNKTTTPEEARGLVISSNQVRNADDGIFIFSALDGIFDVVISNNAVSNCAISYNINDFAGVGTLDNICLLGNLSFNASSGDARIDSSKVFVKDNNFSVFAFSNLFRVLTDLDTTPDLNGASYWNAANTGATSITAFENAELGREKYITFSNANTTFVHSSVLLLSGAGNVNPTTNSIMKFMFVDLPSPAWHEVSRKIV